VKLPFTKKHDVAFIVRVEEEKGKAEHNAESFENVQENKLSKQGRVQCEVQQTGALLPHNTCHTISVLRVWAKTFNKNCQLT
jgi:hypothetical protein